MKRRQNRNIEETKILLKVVMSPYAKKIIANMNRKMWTGDSKSDCKVLALLGACQ